MGLTVTPGEIQNQTLVNFLINAYNNPYGYESGNLDAVLLKNALLSRTRTASHTPSDTDPSHTPQESIRAGSSLSSNRETPTDMPFDALPSRSESEPQIETPTTEVKEVSISSDSHPFGLCVDRANELFSHYQKAFNQENGKRGISDRVSIHVGLAVSEQKISFRERLASIRKYVTAPFTKTEVDKVTMKRALEIASYTAFKQQIQRTLRLARYEYSPQDKGQVVKNLIALADKLKIPRDLSGLNLAGADLRGLDLRDVNFTNSILQEANLNNAQINGNTLFVGSALAKITCDRVRYSQHFRDKTVKPEVSIDTAEFMRLPLVNNNHPVFGSMFLHQLNTLNQKQTQTSGSNFLVTLGHSQSATSLFGKRNSSTQKQMEIAFNYQAMQKNETETETETVPKEEFIAVCDSILRAEKSSSHSLQKSRDDTAGKRLSITKENKSIIPALMKSLDKILKLGTPTSPIDTTPLLENFIDTFIVEYKAFIKKRSSFFKPKFDDELNKYKTDFEKAVAIFKRACEKKDGIECQVLKNVITSRNTSPLGVANNVQFNSSNPSSTPSSTASKK